MWKIVLKDKCISILIFFLCCLLTRLTDAAQRPNILLVISDDQSYPYASAYGCSGLSTPAFDRVAKEGVLFTNAFAGSPGCSPSRASLLTGRHAWQIEHAGTHASWFPTKYRTYPELLAEQGYFVGFTGKGWGPGRHIGREHNPAGPDFSELKTKPRYSGINSNDYAANFVAFLEAKPDDQPFCFWMGAKEPHRSFEKDSWKKAGKRLEDAVVPPYLPDRPEVRGDILDYCVEIEWFDKHLGRILDELEQTGELDNTLVIVTSDNGMSFPRAKANCYEDGIHVPLAIRWGSEVKGGRTVDAFVGFVDLTSTILEAAGVTHPSQEFPPVGRSITNLLTSEVSGTVDVSRNAVFSSRERHSSSRYHTLGYPQRVMRTESYLVIRNFRPDRWPAGAPQKYHTPPKSDEPGLLGPPEGGYHDIDACPTLTFLIEHQDDPEVSRALHLAVDRRPAIEIFSIHDDPGCLKNLADDPSFADTKRQLVEQLDSHLLKTADPRIVNGGEIFETFRRYSSLRFFPAPEDVVKREQQLREEGWRQLFNGYDLTGWKLNGEETAFEVINGMIKAESRSGQAHLFYTGDVADADFTDFELKVDCLCYPHANGGVYFHTSSQESGFPNDGHEVQVNNTHINSTRTGSLFGVVDRDQSLVTDEVFITLHVTVRGKRVTVDVDGTTTVDYTEPEGYQHPKYTGRNIDHGTFALQAHDPDSVVFYRNIWVRPLN